MGVRCRCSGKEVRRYLPQELRPLAVKSCRRAGVCLKSSGGMLRALIYKKSGGAL